MAEFEIIGEEVDEATRAFLQQEEDDMAALGQAPVAPTPAGAFKGFEDTPSNGFEDDNNPFGAVEEAGSNTFGEDEVVENQQGNLDIADHMDHMEISDNTMDNMETDKWQSDDIMQGDDEFPPMPDNSDPYSAISNADNVMAEPEAIRLWRDEQASRLAALDAASAQGMAAMKAKAQEDLASFYHNYQEQQMAQRSANKEAHPDMTEPEADPKADWEKVCSMCDFNPKTAKGQKDTSRMRGLLLGLKQNPLVR